MPVITAIRRQQKRTDRYAVYVDKQYRFSLPDLELSASGLRVGDELTEAEIAAMQRQAGESKAYDMALRFLSVRVRSVREVRDYLVRKGSDPDEAAVIVQRLETTGCLDDQAFA
ncbi:MAG TPA: hypothetical protein VLF67_01355, partial [Candidatus Saccharimonas sp.]|nr:hypothetical protein [Candidatus Saccharimonas sp.]